MSAILRSTIFLSLLFYVCGITGQEFISPCPDLLTYLPAESTSNSWAAEITLKTEVDLSGIYLRLILDQAPSDITTSFGEIVQREAAQYLIRKPDYKLSPGSNEKVKVTVQYTDTIPKITGFRLNAKTVCPAEEHVATDTQIIASPCPYVFLYDPPGAEKDTWTGVLTLSSDSELTGIYSRINFDKPPLEVSADFGDVVQRETTSYLIRKPGHQLPVGTALKIKLSVKFDPAEPAPRLVQVQLNAKSICPGELSRPAAPPPIAKGLVSPCPNIFAYQSINKEAGKWYAVLLLNIKIPVNDWHVTILLDRPSLQLGGWHGYLRTQDNIEYDLSKPGAVLQPGIYPIKFFIKYKATRPIPKLSEVQLNKLNICPVDEQSILNPIPPGVINEFLTAPNTPPPAPQISSGGSDDDFFTGSLDHFKKHGLPLGLNRDEEECGIVTQQVIPLITHGQETIPGQHPWHTAIYHNKQVQLTYICGANLISKKYVLTVAHCATKPSTGTSVNPRTLVVVLGKFYLERLVSDGIQERMVQSIIVHPNYEKSMFKNDLALLKLNAPARITDTVRPICLWTDPMDINTLIGQEGTVVGWGWNENGVLSDQLVKTKMPIVSRITCVLSLPSFFATFTNEMNYCAGFRNGSSACNGDSGGGMALPKTQNGKTVWYLRGLVSIGVALQNLERCDPSHYVIFTDVAKYITWIKNIISKIL